MPRDKEAPPNQLDLKRKQGEESARRIVEATRNHLELVLRTRREAEIEAARYAGVISALGVDIKPLVESLPKIVTLLEEIDERLKKIEEKLEMPTAKR